MYIAEVSVPGAASRSVCPGAATFAMQSARLPDTLQAHPCGLYAGIHAGEGLSAGQPT